MIPKTIHYCWFGGNSMPGNFQYYMHEAIINCITACFSYVFTAFLH